jgi:eukaryotic-like serine/threonine-protein kinase
MHRARSATADGLLGAVIDQRFRILQYLGCGGVGNVYVAEGLRGGGRNRPQCTIKVLREEHRANEKLLARFAREVSAASRIADPRVLEIYDFGAFPDGLPYFVAELLVGLDLGDTLSFARTLVPTRAVRITIDTALALDAAHAAGVIHRDVKPENIFLVHAPDGRELVKLLDFGFAWIEGDPGGKPSLRLTTSRTAVGTPEYMPPEQAAGEVAHPTADIYALGVVLYEMLSGRAPFVGTHPELAEQHAIRRPRPMRELNPELAISHELAGIVQKALEKEPTHRFPSAVALSDALHRTPEGQNSPRER